MSAEIIQFKPVNRSANTTASIIESSSNYLLQTLKDNSVDIENPHVAFDVATILFLLEGLAHRSQGNDHASQALLNKLRMLVPTM